ncbi:MAG: ABC transporter permease, partial [Dehalococcoidia bacterium]
MQRYIAQRILLVIPTLVILTTAVFALVRLVPGDPVAILLSEQAFSTQWDHEQLRHELGLDQPIARQYIDWVSGLARGDFGVSLYSGEALGPTLVERFKVSAE